MTSLRLVSTTLVGAGRATEAAGALESFAPLVDDQIVIDTAPVETPSLHVPSHPPCTSVFRFPWPGRFDLARNECLRLALDARADWSVMVDSDERMVCPDVAAVRAYLAALDLKVQIVCVFAADGTYQRERFFRGTIQERWTFRTHESIKAGPGEQATIPAELISWAELPKTGEMVVTKSKRDVELIREDLLEYPNEPRLYFYLGNSLAHIGPEHYEEAIGAYRKVAEVGTGEGCAWACFCAARLYFEQSQIASGRMVAAKGDEETSRERAEMWRLAYKALDCCSAGIHRKVSIAELHWLAACIHHAIGNHMDGLAYARQAALYGRESLFFEDRHGFMVPAALTDGPRTIEAWCLASIKADATPMASNLAPLLASLDAAMVAATGKMVPGVARIQHVRGPLHVTVTGTGFRAAKWAARCIDSVSRQTVRADHIYIAADDETLAAARAVKSNTVDGRGNSAFENLVPLWRSLPDEEVVVWLDGDDWLVPNDALEIVLRAHESGALVTYGQFQWMSTGQPGFAAQHDHTLPRASSPWRATILRTFRAGLVRRIKEEDLRWPKWAAPGSFGLYSKLFNEAAQQLGDWTHLSRSNDFAGKWLDATLDQAVMLPCLELAGADRARFIPEVLATYMDENLANLSDAAKFHEREALLYIRSRAPYARIEVWP